MIFLTLFVVGCMWIFRSKSGLDCLDRVEEEEAAIMVSKVIHSTVDGPQGVVASHGLNLCLIDSQSTSQDQWVVMGHSTEAVEHSQEAVD